MQNITIYSELEQAINNAQDKVGTRSLIYYLKRIGEHFDYQTDIQFKLIESLVMHDFNIRINDIQNSQSTEVAVVNARRIIMFLLQQFTKLSDSTICDLLNISRKTQKRYKKTMLMVIQNPKMDQELYKRYKRIENLITVKP